MAHAVVTSHDLFNAWPPCVLYDFSSPNPDDKILDLTFSAQTKQHISALSQLRL
ncbi:hypothetical protein Slin15195_G129970 [Septoria linicola]|uniref:Uncharacterized protein n=1 Tax=Septoria linicola TaxID=215465 RepID=A0A9Q9B643_9PEZI|nr:hypothetical protein Slin15195_G129970 [Septoria linicola]